MVTNYKGVSLYYAIFSLSAIHSRSEHIIKYTDSTTKLESFYNISFIGNPTWRIKLEKDTLILYYDSNTDYLVVRTWFNEKGNKSYSLEHVDKKNLGGYFFTSEEEGIFKSENNSWVRVDSYENEGRYMLTPFQYQKSHIVRIPIEKIIDAINNSQ